MVVKVPNTFLIITKGRTYNTFPFGKYDDRSVKNTSHIFENGGIPIALETLADQGTMSHVIDLESKITVNNVIVKFWCTGWRIAQRYSQPKRFYP